MTVWQTNFRSGEVSREAAANFDAPYYGAAAEVLQNVFVQIEGGFVRAAGTEYIASGKNIGEDIHLIPFTKSDEVGVIIVAGDLYFSFFDAYSGESLGAPDVVTPYPLADLPWLYYWQSGDVMWVTEKRGKHAPQILVSFADDDWSLTAYKIVNGPFQPENQGNVTLTNSTAGGIGTVSASLANTIDAGHIGALFWIGTPDRAISHKQWQPEEAIDSADTRIYDGKVYQAVGSGTCSNQPPVHISGSHSDGSDNISWNFLHDLAGVIRISAIANSTIANMDVEARLPQIQATRTWAEGHFSTKRGWPFVGGLFQSRLYFAGSPSFPDTIWGSRIDGWNITQSDFKQRDGSGQVTDDHAVVRTLNDNEVNRIAWFMTSEQIVMGHSGGIVRVSGPSLDEPITPAGISASRPEPPPGTRFETKAIHASQSIVYISETGRRIIALNPLDFSFQTVTALARHVADIPLRKLAYAQEPYYRLYALADDGRLFACTYDQEQKMTAWVRLIPGGKLNGQSPAITDIAVRADADGYERLWMTVKRTINGQTISFVERMAQDFQRQRQRLEDAHFLDAAVTVSAWNQAPAKSIQLSHAQGSDAARRDADVTLNAIGFTWSAADVGKELRARRPFVAVRADQSFDANAYAEISAIIISVNGGVAQARLNRDCPIELYNLSCTEYAFAATDFNGLDHLEGESVGVWGDGVDLGDYTVSAGSISLPNEDASCKIVIGLRKDYRARSLNIVNLTESGPTKGKPVSASRLYIDIPEAATNEGLVRVVSDGVPQEGEKITARNAGDLMSVGVGLKHGIFRTPIVSRHAIKLQIELYGNGAGPLSVAQIGVDQ